MNTSIINTTNLCRTCLIENVDEMQSIYDYINVGVGSLLVDQYNQENNALIVDKKQLSHMLGVITSTTVSQSDNLPTKICRKCAQNVRRSYEFKNQCETSFAKLKAILNQNIAKKMVDDDGNNSQFDVSTIEDLFLSDEETQFNKLKCETRTNLKDMQSNGFQLEISNKKDLRDGDRAINFDKTCLSGSPPELSNQIAEIMTIWECINCGKICKNEIEAKKHACNLNKIVSNEISPKSGDADYVIYEMQEQNGEMKTKLNNDNAFPLSSASKNIKSISPICESISSYNIKNKISLRNKGDIKFAGIKLRSGTLTSDNKANKVISDMKNSDEGDGNVRNKHTVADDISLIMASGMRSRSQSVSTSNQATRNIYCDVCKHTFIDDEHTKNCQGNLENKKPTCSICNAVFKEKCGLFRHMVIHSDDRPFECTICKKSFKRSSNLKEHLLVHSKDRLTCTICDIQFESAKYLSLHNREQHTAVKSKLAKEKYICDICSRGFRQLSELETHIKIHLGIHLNKCKFCTAIFKSKQEKNEHMRKLHLNEMRPFLCSQCGARCGSEAQYKDHIHRHAGVKPYQCKFCNKAFTRKNELTIHERYHTDEKPYICTICGKGFFRPSSLTIHTRTHTGERPYKCTFCTNAYTQIQVLKTHLRRHTGEQFVCDICGTGYIERHLLSQHKRNVHGINVTAKTGRLEKFIQSSK